MPVVLQTKRLKMVRRILTLAKKLPRSPQRGRIEDEARDLQALYTVAGDRDVSFSIIRTPVTIRIDEGPEGKRQLNIEAGEREPIHCYDARNITVIRTCESRWEITVTSPGGTTFAVITKEAPMMPTESHPRLEYFDIVEGRDSDEVE